MIEVKLPKLKCLRCGHEWTPRYEKLPIRCPNCLSKNWNKERKRKKENKNGDK